MNVHPWPTAPQRKAAEVDPIVLQIVEGTNQIQRMVIGRSLARAASSGVPSVQSWSPK